MNPCYDAYRSYWKLWNLSCGISYVKLKSSYLVLFFELYVGCQVGFFGYNCTQPCRYPSFGDKCQRQCNCSQDICDHITGCTTIEGKYKNLVFYN